MVGLSKKKSSNLKLRLLIDSFIEGVAVPCEEGLPLLCDPHLPVMQLLQDCCFQIPFRVAWQVEMSASCFNILVNIVEVFTEPFLQASTGLANILLPAVGHTAGDGIADVPRTAVHGGGQVHFEICGFC